MNLETKGTTISMPLPDLRHLMAAQGYIELGMFDEADGELFEMNPLFWNFSPVLTVKLCILGGQQKWDAMQILARKMVRLYPDDVHWQIWWAAATQRTHSIGLAKEILVRALNTHPDDPRLHYTLSCYEIQLQNVKRARQHLARAIALDRRFKSIALAEEDLEPLWQTLGQERER